jgi:GT2 family glycosyltransferase
VVDCVVGYAFGIRAEVFDAIGGVDVAYTPAGYEEIDLCMKSRQHGLHNYSVPAMKADTEILHGISARNESIEYMGTAINTLDLHARNTAYFKAKWRDVIVG